MFFSPLSASSFSPPLHLLVYSSSSRSHSPHPSVRAQVHISHYSPAERYSPPVRPHLSPSFSQSSFSLIIISPGRQIIANRTLSLVISLFFSFLFFFFYLFCLVLVATISSWPPVPPSPLQLIQFLLFFRISSLPVWSCHAALLLLISSSWEKVYKSFLYKYLSSLEREV